MATTKSQTTLPLSNTLTLPPNTPMAIAFQTAYGPRHRVQLVKGERSGSAKQSFKDECDINFILSRFRRTRVLDWVSKNPPRYGDATGYDFQRALDIVVKGREAFESLPAHIRSRFANDPAQFLDFVHDPENRDDMRKMGLLRPEDDVQPPGATRVAPPPASDAQRVSGEAGEASTKGAKPPKGDAS